MCLTYIPVHLDARGELMYPAYMPCVYMSDAEFEKLVAAGIDAIPEEFRSKMKNVAVTVADFPDENQLKKVKARPGTTLFGLYEGIPQTERGGNYSGVLPDKITIFKIPLLCVSEDEEDLKERVKHTVWHEVAHHFGLDHKMIGDIERRRKS